VTAVLALRGLGKDYGDRRAVGAIDLDVVRGEILGLLGPNGAGKTTMISMACGVVTPSRGSVAIAGIELASDPHAAKAKLGLVPQDLAVYEELTAVQNLRYFGALYGLAGRTLADRADWALGVVGLTDRARDVVKTYSGGMKRRLNLAAGLVHKPQLLVLDEPTVGVDPQSRNHIFETVRALRAEGMTVIYTSHYMEEVEALCDRVAIMDAGAIAATGTIAELVAKHAGKGIALEIAGDVDAAAKAAAAHAVVERVGQPSEAATGAEPAGSLADRTSRDASTLRVVPNGPLAPVIAAIEATGATIARIESREATLETAFLALTGKSLRDEGAS
jgi:ABC-2 type transport system ATP-binding protein